MNRRDDPLGVAIVDGRLWANSYRHEYDHACGYDGENQLYVEPVCSRCHHIREEDRRGLAA